MQVLDSVSERKTQHIGLGGVRYANVSSTNVLGFMSDDYKEALVGHMS